MPVILHSWDDSLTHLPSTQTSLNLFIPEDYGRYDVYYSTGFPITYCFVLLFNCLVYYNFALSVKFSVHWGQEKHVTNCFLILSHVLGIQ